MHVDVEPCFGQWWMDTRSDSHESKRQKGFTIVELAIVLVIIGLLVGGVLVGRQLIQQAELQSMLSEIDEINGTIQTFKMKYNALPGDMRRATQFWGAADGADGLSAACTDQEYLFPDPPDALTCNGDGDGRIAGSSGYDTSYEKYRLWEHLSNAEMIQGSYTGSRDAQPFINHVGVFPGANILESARSGVGYMLLYHNGGASQYNYYYKPGHYLVIGGGGWNLHWPDNAAFSAQEAWKLDQKIDDGKPGTGNVMVSKPNYTEEYGNTPDGMCATTDDEATAEYYADRDSLNISARGCSPWIYTKL
jgi:prepilin-type N-terminal cleavage/methylation domain-containing protein